MSRRERPTALVQLTDGSGPTARTRWLRFGRPAYTLTAHRLDEVRSVIEAAEAAALGGAWVTGYVAYEAAAAFDPALTAHDPIGSGTEAPLPLCWWAVFEHARTIAAGDLAAPLRVSPTWRPGIEREAYRRAIAAIHRAIARGDTYQVNFTFPWHAAFTDAPEGLFTSLVRNQAGRYGAYLDSGRFVVCSATPELFFARHGDRLVARPMKGTASRGTHAADDRRAAARLRGSAKNRAENLMIVDMMRNDLGKIARTGSVRVPRLFDVETYPTVHQMTSTVEARSDPDRPATLAEIFAALFPCASITGAPKVATMKLIHSLESGPRGVYTGAVVTLSPGGDVQAGVAIRTVTVDRQTGTAHYGTGGGIVWDSDAETELAECRAKALILSRHHATTRLFETLRWQPRPGFFLLERHLARMASSARYYGMPFDRRAAARQLLEASAAWPAVRHRVRLVLADDGRTSVEATAFPCTGRTVWRLALDDRPVDPKDAGLYHKTTARQRYRAARARHPDADEVLLVNGHGELTEATRANLVLRLDDRWLTPRLDAGLLPGTYRQALLERGRIEEATLPIGALRHAREVFLINALRGWIRTLPPGGGWPTSDPGIGYNRHPAPRPATAAPTQETPS